MQNHCLFEVATEVANRGNLHPNWPQLMKANTSELAEFTQSSSQRPRSPQQSMALHILFWAPGTGPRQLSR